MAIIPTVRRRSMKAALAFYTGMLDFERVDGNDDVGDPSFSVLSRDGDQIFQAAPIRVLPAARRRACRRRLGGLA